MVDVIIALAFESFHKQDEGTIATVDWHFW
jgi:hypothetical protein